MLADDGVTPSVGRLTPTLHRPAEWIGVIIDLIYQQLPRWRDDPERKALAPEDKLTSQLCQFLNAAARGSHLDSIVFQTEVPDPEVNNRTLDLVPVPCGCTIWVGGQRYTYYDPLIPIECKRLPTPRGAKREEQEYLHTQHGKKGGVQRFRAGLHGSTSKVGAIIAYIQVGSAPHWFTTINQWIGALTQAGIDNWSCSETLHDHMHDVSARTARSCSSHPRDGLDSITLQHLWVEM
ncbi:hypothetical protein [Sphingomonas sp. LHG3443-2]|uniref:hypothetical protein n=1 Tax=Sphingomonas sp. LHG3443-2 TaxID=2804639 RepID=UPI003CEFBF08